MGMPARNGRKPYVKPTVRRIKLVAEELAVTGCKTRLSRSGPTLGCFRTNCRSIGS
jgi:hypothetical protein